MKILTCLPAAALALALALITPPALALSVDEGYAAIPHKRQPFDAKASLVAKTELQGLERLFGLVDQAVVLRAETLRAHGSASEAAIKRSLEGYSALIAAMEKEKPSEAVAPARDKILQALRDQRRFFEARAASGGPVRHQEYRMSPEMREASRLLFEAYRVLLTAFPGEGRHNKTAFRNYMNALDYY